MVSTRSGSKVGSSPPGTPQRRPQSPTGTPNLLLGMLIQLSRKYLFLDARRKAIFYFCAVALLSIAGSVLPLSMESYWVQKHNIFNQYGVKLGWFWTCAIVGPFIWYSAKMHHTDKDRVIVDVLRLGVATLMWYLTVAGFHKFAHATSRCDKSLKWNRDQCSANGGAWIPGVDISGHCFLMLYSILILCEESSAFRQWCQLQSGDTPTQKKEFQLNAQIVQIFFVAMFVLHVFWDTQLVISVLYYHIFIDKVLGAAAAIFCWFITYRLLYPAGFLAMPIHRKKPVL